MVDDLLLVERSPDLGPRLGIFLVIIPDHLFLSGVGAHARDQSLAEFIVGNRDAGLFANIGEQQTKTHAAFGDPLVLGAGGLLGGAFVLEAAAALALLGGHAAPHLIEFLRHQPFGQFKGIFFVERVEKFALPFATGGGGVVARDIRLDRFFQLVEILKAEAFRQFVVDRDIARRGDSLERHVEGRGLAGQMRRGVILREGDRDGPALTDRKPFELRLEARDEAAAPEHEILPFA